MSSAPRVSVVMPTYNRPRLLARAVRSIQAQTIEDWEVVCVDDGSAEPAAPALARLADPRIGVVTLADNGGASRARNVGIERARADLIAFLDDDNEWQPDFLEAQLDRLGSADGARAAVSHCLAVRQDDATGRRIAPGRAGDGDALRRLVAGWCPFMSCTVIRRPAVLRSGGLDDRLPAFEDYDLFLRLAMAGSTFVGIPRALVVRHEHHAAGTISGDVGRLRRAAEALDAKWEAELSGRLGRLRYRRWRAWLAASVRFADVRRASARGDRLGAWRAALGSVPLAPWAPAYPARAIALAALGLRGYRELARVKDAMMPSGAAARTR